MAEYLDKGHPAPPFSGMTFRWPHYSQVVKPEGSYEDLSNINAGETFIPS